MMTTKRVAGAVAAVKECMTVQLAVSATAVALSLLRKGMMTMSKEVLKLALEALDIVKIHYTQNRHVNKAITAIKEALAQPETLAWPCLIAEADFSENTVTLAMQCTDYKVSAGKHWLSTTPPQPEKCKYGQEPKSCTSNPMDCQCALDAALAQPEQEPVAWLEGETIYWKEDQGLNDWIRKNGEPLYTTPPQRKPLTDDEIDKAWRSVDYTVSWEQHRIDIARAIEAKLRSKNNG